MGEDGARGCPRFLLPRGDLAQDEETSAVYGMPGAALMLGAVQFSGNAKQIAKQINEIRDHDAKLKKLDKWISHLEFRDLQGLLESKIGIYYGDDKFEVFKGVTTFQSHIAEFPEYQEILFQDEVCAPWSTF